MTVLR
ncbi:oxygen-independent coproporphyrinogen III oxidase, partial [Yersinia pestis PY-58]|jgi:hypothetical protein